MRQGKHFRIPERPADVEFLWREGKRLEAGDLPAWLLPDDSSEYRLANIASTLNLSDGAPKDFKSEMEELELAGMIVEPETNGHSGSRVYIPAPLYPDLWSIGIYSGDSPLNLTSEGNAKNPVITRDDVTDVSAVFVADPFIIKVKDLWYMFFEVMNWRTNKGEIGLAISSDGRQWRYERIVLSESFHLSYPYVFEWMGEHYMIPESYQAGSIRLYKAVDFPADWSFVGTLLEGPYLVDASVFRYDDKWWLFTETNRQEKHDTLRLYFADNLTGPWREHPQSPIVQGNAEAARPAGRVLIDDGRIFRFAQNCAQFYGTSVRAFEITKLTATEYAECEVGPCPIVGPGEAIWNGGGMHHIDAHKLDNGSWLACVDGWRRASE
jgi:hypothetical protein